MPLSNLVHKRHSHPLVFIAAVILAGFLIYPFITPLMLSAITAYVLRPVVKRLQIHTRSYHLALGILVLIIAIPIIIVISYISSNSALFFSDIMDFSDKIKTAISAVSGIISATGFGAYANYLMGAQDITARLTAFSIALASEFIKKLPVYALDFVIYLYATYHFMREGGIAVRFVKSYASTLPAEDEHFLSSILKGLRRSFDVLFLSYITMSVIITIISFIMYSIFGAPHAAILAVLTGLFGFLPILGVWMVYVPVAVYMYTIGNVFAAVGIIVFGVAILNLFIPIVLQPYLGSKKSGISPLTILLGFFSGPIIFGAKGILLGPILFVMVETIIVEYMRYRIAEKS